MRGLLGGAGVGGSTSSSNVAYGGRSAEEEARAAADAAHMEEKDKRIAELEDMVDILNQKVRKLDQLVRLKDSRINALSARLVSGVGWSFQCAVALSGIELG